MIRKSKKVIIGEDVQITVEHRDKEAEEFKKEPIINQRQLDLLTIGSLRKD